ncbi:MarR family winged helix-turn-helix transcriptional regulator [Chondrinema litorale]|uniref:MarR family winged helix-turn-helix transcriptional regulator n=1 Tax=Chondrinema litorale TaxID=2994555 RepID=UPI002543F9DC|nr:MarR family transcriptional regulator [Chondrinema litorale]UZR92559.1 MarR family transcriptional regulator [Chondrinema litorale]
MEIEKLLFEIIDFISNSTKENKEGVLSEDEFSKLTIKQYFYLDLISRMENPTFTELADALQITKPSVSAIVNKLVDKGYIIKVQSEDDQRSYNLHLSDKGKTLIEAENKIYRAFSLHIRTTLNPDEQQQFVHIMKKILKTLPR